ncbi:hypothetical protein KIN20_002481 [Parelaphostrongylus tenuis]|uniref:Uncharacterized protein n=1 Tax=Parelaphostrongylus tenuis TaxID=148309 RepID=A0AAD5MGV8_PARTN|nr:hypothetical protein KIN20_002481 [Parelaphostrongylus tenuis]
MEGTIAKKTRVWNPAIDNSGVIDDKLISEDDRSSDGPINISRIPNSNLLFIIQNYFHVARVQQQRVVEEALRRGFISPFPVPPIMTLPSRQNLPCIMPPPLQSMDAASSMKGCQYQGLYGGCGTMVQLSFFN